MKHIKIQDPNKNGHFNFVEIGDFEYANPLQKIRENTILSETILYKNMAEFISKNDKNLQNLYHQLKNPKSFLEKLALKNGVESWNYYYDEILKSEVPDCLFEVLECDSKKQQIKLLKNISLGTIQMVKFIIQAGIDYGYSYSMYSTEHAQSGLDTRKMPFLAKLEDDFSVSKFGKTSLSDGQIKQAIEHRSRTCAKFLDKGNKWHCFFLSYKSLSGKEKAWKNGTPHMHFISYKWGLFRETVLKELRSRHYKFGSLPHIDIEQDT